MTMTEIERLVEDVVLAEHSDSIPRRIAARSALLSSYREMQAEYDELELLKQQWEKGCEKAEADVASLRLELSEARERQLTAEEARRVVEYLEAIPTPRVRNFVLGTMSKLRAIASLPTPTSDVK